MLRGLLSEFGFIIPMGARNLVPAVMGLIEDPDNDIPPVVREMFHPVCGEIRELEAHIQSVEGELEALASQMP
jgi:transposase